MWSGPRNISTAMMRAFGSRSDAAVVDEPFYAAYLSATGIDHPMREEVIATGETDPTKVEVALLGPVPGDRPVFYQKHMAHHMIPSIGRGFIDRVANAFLIRRPEAVLASYTEKRGEVTLADIGFVQQAEIFDRVADRLGRAPPVIEADDVLADPAGMLSALCAELGLAYDPKMTRWEPGLRPTDGIWAKHWYGAVERSTGFSPPRAEARPLPEHLKPIADAALPLYEQLARWRLRPAAPRSGPAHTYKDESEAGAQILQRPA